MLHCIVLQNAMTSLCRLDLQMSDWERRPLSDRQLTYAALDAFVLLQIFDAITQGKDAINQQQLQQFISTYSAQGPQHSTHHSRVSPSHGRNSSDAIAQSEATSTDTHFAVAGTGLDSSTYSSPMTMTLPESAKQASPARPQHCWPTGGELQHTNSTGTQASLVRHDALQRGCPTGAHDHRALQNLLQWQGMHHWDCGHAVLKPSMTTKSSHVGTCTSPCDICSTSCTSCTMEAIMVFVSTGKACATCNMHNMPYAHHIAVCQFVAFSAR